MMESLRLEWLNTWRSAPVRIGLAALSVLIVIGFVVGQRTVGERRATLAVAEQEILDARRGPIPGLDSVMIGRDSLMAIIIATRFGSYATLTPTPLSPLALGGSAAQPYYFRVTTRSAELTPPPDDPENPVNLRDGRFDLAFVLVQILPLLILATSYNLLSSEREQNTLPLLRAQPCALWSILSARLVLRLILFALVAVGLPLVLLLSTGGLTAPDAWPRLVYFAIALTSYIALWLGLAALVNGFGRSSKFNAMTLMSVWLLLTLIIPTALGLLVARLHPIPSRVALVSQVRTVSRDASAEGSKLLARYYEDHPELAPNPRQVNMDDFFSRSYSVQAAVERATDTTRSAFNTRLRDQQQSIERFRWGSPAIVMQQVLEEVSGNSAARYLAYQDQVTAYRRAWNDFILPYIFRQQYVQAAQYAQMPTYQFVEEDAAALRRRLALPLGWLLWLALMLGIGARATISRAAMAS